MRKDIRMRMIAMGLSTVLTISTVVSGTTYKTFASAKNNSKIIISSFDNDLEGWEPQAGYEYSHGNLNSQTRGEKAEISYDQTENRMALYLDYSANATAGWSEAKIMKRFDQGLNIENYNEISFRITYPEKLSFITKISGSSLTGEIIGKQAEFVEGTVVSLGNGRKTGIVKVSFKPNGETLHSLTLGIVGINTDYVGNVYIDDVTMSNFDLSGDYVKITSDIKSTPDTADLSKMLSTVKLVDADATDETTALASYLKAVMANEQILIGHQNTTFCSVGDSGKTSDVEDVLGTLPAIAGIDTLALSGGETGCNNPKEALNKSVEISKRAYQNGAIVTLSSHMPNFTSSQIIKKADGTYDFTACNTTQSKDSSNNCEEQILEGGAYNDVYNAYLDMIAEYALELQKDNVPILFRPFHENNGSWFWWGSQTSVDSYKAIFRYLVDYLKDKGVHNLLYVYSPNGPITSEEEYLERYPGDEYIDIVAFDYYDDYYYYPANYSDQFFTKLTETCEVVASVAKNRGKIPAIAEIGCRVTRANGDFSGLAVKDNPVLGHDWYGQVQQIAKKTGMPYYLLWANVDEANFYVPYKYDDQYGQELINDFIELYNNESSIFANGTNFYGADGAVSKNVIEESYANPMGSIVSHKNNDTIMNPTTVKAEVKNGKNISFILKESATSKGITLTAKKDVDGLYAASIDSDTLQKLGKTDVGSITVMASGKIVSVISNISFNKDKDSIPSVPSTENTPVYVTSVALNKKTVSLTPEKTVKLSATIYPQNAANRQVSWTTSNSKVATIKDGVVTAVSPGTATITVATNDQNKKATCLVTVKPVKVTKITLNTKNTTMVIGQTRTLKVTKITPNNATTKNITWKTSNSKVVKVSANGKITAVGIGKANVLAVSKDGSNITAKCTIVVNPKKVTDLKATNIKKTSIKLAWKKQSGVSGYQVYQYDAKKKSYKLYKTTKNNQLTVTKLGKNKTYKFKVVAYKKVGKTTYKGESSKVKTIKTKK